MPKNLNLPSVSFYQVAGKDVAKKRQIACRLAAQGFSLGEKLFILTSNEEESQQIDELLWHYPTNRFVPHAVNNGNEAKSASTTVRIYHETPADNQYLLINLTANQITNLGRFRRIFEVALENERDAANAREEHYRKLGCVIETHKISPARL